MPAAALRRDFAGHQPSKVQPTEIPAQASDCQQLQRLSDAIERLAGVEPRLAQVVDLKSFGGFSFGDIAAMWQISARTVRRDWEKARLMLHAMLAESGDHSLAGALVE